MSHSRDVRPADPDQVIDFLNKTRPFKDLDQPILQDLAKQFLVDFFPKGTVVLEQDRTNVDYLYLIFRGGVKAYLVDSDGTITLKDFRGEGGSFGALGIIRDSKANLTVECIEDTFCYLLKKEIFLKLITTYPRFSEYFLRKFSQDIIGTCYTELRSQRIRPRTQDGLYLFSTAVGDIVKRTTHWITGSETIQTAAMMMTQYKIGSLLVRNPSNQIVGIVTDKDLRIKAVAKGLDYHTPVDKIMSSPVLTIPSTAVCFDALLQMMDHQVHHLAVSCGDELIGVITAHDIMVHQGTSPFSLFREIVAQRTFEGLYSLSEKVVSLVRTLIVEGAKANNITRMISVLNDHIVNRVLTLLEEELGPAPQPFCWLMMGSEGRHEQTFKTDQDNALLYDTPPEEWEAIKVAKLYFRRFGNQAIQHLARCGYPLCKGEIMASNPKWRKPYATWRNYFDRWMSAPEPQAVLHATIFFDFRSGYGTVSLAEQLRDFLVRTAPSRGIFLMHLAKNSLASKPPLTFFRNFVVEKDGLYKNLIDLKTRGIVPFVDFARLFALKHGIKETNTLDRLRTLAERDHIPMDLYTEARDAFEFQMQLRLVHQLKMLEGGQTPNNYIDPADLTELEKQTLREAFSVIGRIQSFIKENIQVVE